MIERLFYRFEVAKYLHDTGGLSWRAAWSLSRSYDLANDEPGIDARKLMQ
jgi:hypothetical protein